MHTQDYMLEHLLQKRSDGEDNNLFQKFDIKTTREWEQDFYFKANRRATLERKGQQMVFQNSVQLKDALKKIIADKFERPSDCVPFTH